VRSARSLLVVAGAAALVGCTAFDAYPTAPASPDPGAAAGPRVAICYNRLLTSLAGAQSQAQKECAAGTVAKPVDTDWYLNVCTVLLPSHATFVCTPTSRK
jgi:hypothetical protein